MPHPPTRRPVTAVVLVALQEEALAVIEQLSVVREITNRFHRYYDAVLDDERVIVWPVGAMGNVASAIAARNAIAVHNPGVLVLTGITGGFRKRGRSLGDVVVPDQLVSYESGKLQPGAFVPRWEVYRPSIDFRTAAQAVEARAWWGAVTRQRPADAGASPSVHFGVLASGEKVVADDQFARDIIVAWDRAAGVEMESVGVALAAYESGERPAFGVVKSISDWADSTKADDWRPYATQAAAVFTLEVIRTLAQTLVEARPQPQVVNSTLSTHVSLDLRAGWGQKRIKLCRDLTPDEASEVADWFDIQSYERARFSEGVCRGVWDWLERRDKLSELPNALAGAGRADLAALVEAVL